MTDPLISRSMLAPGILITDDGTVASADSARRAAAEISKRAGERIAL